NDLDRREPKHAREERGLGAIGQPPLEALVEEAEASREPPPPDPPEREGEDGTRRPQDDRDDRDLAPRAGRCVSRGAGERVGGAHAALSGSRPPRRRPAPSPSLAC